MPAPCVVPGCPGTGPGSFNFPSDAELNLKWRTAIRKEISSEPQKTLSWKPSEYSRVCGSHFKPDDFRESLATMYSAKPTVICENILVS